jgi:acylphosphatase
MSAEEICRRARISGRVQMVWYRAWTVGEAQKRGLSGWVRNRKDGSVEALFSGEADAVEAMLAACREGPPKAEVTDIAVQPADPPDGPGFHQLASE